MTSMTNAPPSPVAWQDDTVFRQHRTLCGLALPLRVPKAGFWSREVGEARIAMGTDAPAVVGETSPLPAGRLARLLLLHVFTAALRGGSTAAYIGPDAAAAAASLGLEATPLRLRELSEQVERLVAARLQVAVQQGASLAVLDARRSGGRVGQSAWCPVLHLTERFFASLQQDAVTLDRNVVTALAGSASALDAYAWVAATQPKATADRSVSVPWAELRQRFGQSRAIDAAAFRTVFAESLAAVRAAFPSAGITVSQDGVELRGAAASPVVLSPEGTVPAKFVPEQDGSPANAMALSMSAPSLNDQGPTGRDKRPAATTACVEPAHVIAASVPEADAKPRLATAQASTASTSREVKPSPERERNDGRVRLAPVLTGLSQSVWLRRGGGGVGATIEVTPGADYDPSRRSLVILEPMILQVMGGLQPRELDQIAGAVQNPPILGYTDVRKTAGL